MYRLYEVEGRTYRVQYWDCPGAERYMKLTSRYCAGAAGAIFVCTLFVGVPCYAHALPRHACYMRDVPACSVPVPVSRCPRAPRFFYLPGVPAVDVNNKTTFDHLEKWIREVQKNNVVLKVLVGNKVDDNCRNAREVTTEMAEQLADKHHMDYFETSAITGTRTDAVFQDIFTQVRVVFVCDRQCCSLSAHVRVLPWVIILWRTRRRPFSPPPGGGLSLAQQKIVTQLLTMCVAMPPAPCRSGCRKHPEPAGTFTAPEKRHQARKENAHQPEISPVSIYGVSAIIV